MKYLKTFESSSQEFYIYTDGKERKVSRESFMNSKGVKVEYAGSKKSKKKKKTTGKEI